MRRSEQEITDRGEIDAIIGECRVCRVAMVDGAAPYVVPMSFGYDGKAVYLHCAPEGQKVEALRRNPAVCVEFDILDGVVKEGEACSWSTLYRSVIAYGTARFIDEDSEKRRALNLLVAHHGGDSDHNFPQSAVDRTLVLQIPLDRVSGKRSG